MKKLLEEIKRLNTSKKIKVRLNPLPEGHSIYLEFNKNYKRERQYLNMKVSDRSRMTKEDEETLYKAEIIRDTRELELFGNSMTFMLQNKLSENDFLQYFSNLADQNKLPSYKACLKKLTAFSKRNNHTSHLRFCDINVKFCQKFKDSLLSEITNKTLANPTAKTYLSVFAAGLNKAFNENLLQSNPAAKIRIKGIESKREFLTEEELKQMMLVEGHDEEIKNAFIFASQTSLRLGDIRSLTFKDIRVNRNNEAYLYFRQHKTKGVSNIMLSDVAYMIYEKQKKDYPNSELVFHLQKSTSIINAKLREMAIDAGITKWIHFHVSRHSWATLALTRGVDIYTVSKIMGHSSVSVTEIYANLINKKRDEVSGIINLVINQEDIDKSEKQKEINKKRAESKKTATKKK